MQTIRVEVDGNYARSPIAEIVCGNSEYYIEFAFSEEWEEHALKTARFFFANSTIDRVFEGNVVQVPIVKDATVLEVGVYAGNLRTTTPALIGCKKSILCRDGTPEEPAEDVYNQIMQKIDEIANSGSGGGGGGGEVPEETVVEIIEKYFEENPIPKEVQNITSIDTVYDTVDDLPTDKGDGTTLLVVSEKSLYSYNSTAKAWEFKHALKPHTVYCVLEDEKAGLYRYTMKSPYLKSVESHTLQEAKDYTDEKIGDIDTALDGIIALQNSFIGEVASE